jgi:hypothetical protein
MQILHFNIMLSTRINEHIIDWESKRNGRNQSSRSSNSSNECWTNWCNAWSHLLLTFCISISRRESKHCCNPLRLKITINFIKKIMREKLMFKLLLTHWHVLAFLINNIRTCIIAFNTTVWHSFTSPFPSKTHCISSLFLTLRIEFFV